MGWRQITLARVALSITRYKNMPNINLQCDFPIRYRNVAEFQEVGPIYPHEVGPFVVHSKAFSVNANTRLVPERQVISVVIPELPISPDLLDWIRQDSSHNANYPATLVQEIEQIKAEADAIARKVVDGFKFFLGRTSIEDDSLNAWQNVLWTQPETTAQSFPIPPSSTWQIRSELPLNDLTRQGLQEAIDNGYEPLLAERHLYRAYQETVPRFRWIDATIAAELAIKEALVRKMPSLRHSLISKSLNNWADLYGKKLKEVCGARSPHLDQIKEGAKRRNKLIHRPTKDTVTEEEASQYVHTVMLAIRHLYILLYPNWKLAKHMSQMRRT
ncbi:hypothetical protein AB6Q13_10340 [Ralstonia solanacearum]|uniref:hypothetical protein n=1 Tax=Ralstonia solanacearum TaxID=305 RepID=UPI00230514E4|nr:hypothetical protein [Ralstonia solanacearum]MDB0567402.1 hypothetical protein [Ralstonia solanacearum]MDB0577222.1 hypothetical protein [Ralstonia solanacearum]